MSTPVTVVNEASESTTLTVDVMRRIHRRIAARELPTGARLPSIRALAETLHVSKSTVVEAYDRLAAEGIITARRGSGFYVTLAQPPLSLAAIGPNRDRAVDPLWVARQSLDGDASMLKPGCGWLPADWFAQDSLRRALRGVARALPGTLSDYPTTLGLPELRRQLARRLGEHSIDAAPEQILLVDSGTQAVDLLCRFLLEPGDTVLVDDPCYFNFQALLRAHRAKVVGVAFTPHGPDLASFEQQLVAHRPKLYLTNSGLHNPTGATLSPVVAHGVLKLADQHGVVIAEDDIFADFEINPAPRLAAFDGLNRVVHVGSFSKTLSASVRCGYLAARADWIEALADLKIATSFGAGGLGAEIVHRVLKDGTYRRHVEALRVRLERARGPVIKRLRTLGIRPWLEPTAGMFLWCELPERGPDATELARAALDQGMVLAPGNVFSVSQTAARFMRFNIAQAADDRLYAKLARLLS